MGIFTINKGTRIVIAIMAVLAVTGFAIAWLYYGNINRSVDPRIKQAQIMYGRYNIFVSENDFDKVLTLLDSIKAIYAAIPHYANSYEMGVMENNRASVFLTIALSDTIFNEIRQNYFALAEHHLNKSVDYYNAWMRFYGHKTEEEIQAVVENEFSSDSLLMQLANLDAIISYRVREIKTAQIEMPRRLSVSYSNLGIIMRHENRLEEAIGYYTKALELWDENLAAKNNLNIIFGKPLEKQGILRKLFPPERKE